MEDIFLDLYHTENISSRSSRMTTEEPSSSASSSFGSIVMRTCYTNRSTAMICLAGLITNVITAFAWGLVVLWAQHTIQLSTYRLATIGAAFTLTKASMMIVASIVSDHFLASRRKPILVLGFTTAFLVLLVTALADTATISRGVVDGEDQTHHQQLQHYRDGVYYYLLLGSIVIGVGIGSVYCMYYGRGDE